MSEHSEWSDPIVLYADALNQPAFWTAILMEWDRIDAHRLATSRPLASDDAIRAFVSGWRGRRHEFARFDASQSGGFTFLDLVSLTEGVPPARVLRFEAAETPKTSVWARRASYLRASISDDLDADAAMARFFESIRYAGQVHTLSFEHQARTLRRAIRRLWSELYELDEDPDLARLRSRLGMRAFGRHMKQFREDAMRGVWRG